MLPTAKNKLYRIQARVASRYSSCGDDSLRCSCIIGKIAFVLKLPSTLQQIMSSGVCIMPAAPVLKFQRVSKNATTPKKGSQKAAGHDLCSAYDYTVNPKDKCLVSTDLKIAIPDGYYGRVAPRSGLALKQFIDIGGGVIDQDYRGNVGIIIYNFSDEEFTIKKGDRIAQLICEKICYPEVKEVENLDQTERGDGGFGSSGIN